MAHPESEQNQHRTSADISRRAFIEDLAKKIGGMTALSVGAFGVAACAPRLSPPAPGEEHIPLTELPEDILTEEQLKKAGIRIHQTPQTQLFLRKSALEIRLFKDSSEGKVGEAVIILVENESLSWNAIRELPEDARLIWDATHASPEEAYQSVLEYKKRELARSKNEDERKKHSEDIEWLTRDREELVRKSAEEGSAGTYIRGAMVPIYFLKTLRARDFLEEHPEFRNKVYIFLPVGGRLAPEPEQSYTEAKWIEDTKRLPGSKSKYEYSSSLPGFRLGHELAHYEIGEFEAYDEMKADLRSHASILKAWSYYRRTGNSDLYPFVFVNQKGITVTKNPAKEEQKV